MGRNRAILGAGKPSEGKVLFLEAAKKIIEKMYPSAQEILEAVEAARGQK